MLLENYIFVEKYRPKNLDEFVSNDLVISRIKNLISQSPEKMPHLLLLSRSPGTGKTTLAKIIVNEIGADCLFLNASDERGITVVREKIKRFVSSYSRKPGIPKIVVLDECDSMTNDAMESLRGIMEEYYKNARFIITGNSEHKIIQPIKSRCLPIPFSLPPKDKILQRLKFICENEKIKYEEKALNIVIDKYYPDMRYMLNKLNEMWLDKRDVTEDNLSFENSLYREIYNKICMGEFENARKMWLENGTNTSDLLKYLYEEFYKNKYLDWIKKTNIIIILSDTDFRSHFGANPELALSAGVAKIIAIISNMSVVGLSGGNG